jgi:hypothetical protein
MVAFGFGTKPKTEPAPLLDGYVVVYVLIDVVASCLSL